MPGREAVVNAKKKILEILELELEQLIIDYENTINQQKEEIEELKARILASENEKALLQKTFEAELLATKSMEKDFSVELTVNPSLSNPSFDEIDEIISSDSIEEMQKLISSAIEMWKRLEIEKLTYAFKRLNEQPNLHGLINGNFSIDIITLFKSILLKENLTEFEHDQLVIEVIELGMKLKDTSVAEGIENFLKRKNDKLFDNILLRNEPSIIISYMRMLLAYGLTEKLKGSLNYLLEVEWGFIDASLKKPEFEFFFWYAYLFNIEKKLISKSDVSLQWFKETSKELAFYYYLSKEKYLKEDLYEMNVNQFKKSTVLSDFEKELILGKVAEQRKLKLEEKPLIYKRPIYIINKSEFVYFNKRYGLEKRRVTLPMYQKSNMHQIYFYSESEVFINNKGDMAFIDGEEFIKLMKDNMPLVIKTGQINYVTDATKEDREKEEDAFSWPSTEVTASEGNGQNEEKTLNETSELKKLGYQITGVTREKRWKALEKAVPQLGLKKVVHIISYNVKLRKGQKNGMKKFAYAISEWEHDLAKLKKHYYKKEFKWPNSL